MMYHTFLIGFAYGDGGGQSMITTLFFIFNFAICAKIAAMFGESMHLQQQFIRHRGDLAV